MTRKRREKADSGCNLTAKPTRKGVHFKFFLRFDGRGSKASYEGKKVKRGRPRVVLGTASVYQEG